MITHCEKYYTPGVDLVYVPNKWAEGNYALFYDLIKLTGFYFEEFQNCMEQALEVVCHYLLPPCGTLNAISLPTSLCKGSCNMLAELCPDAWKLLSAQANDHFTFTSIGVSFLNCSNPGEHLEPLPHCCLDVDFDIRKSITLKSNFIVNDVILHEHELYVVFFLTHSR